MGDQFDAFSMTPPSSRADRESGSGASSWDIDIKAPSSRADRENTVTPHPDASPWDSDATFPSSRADRTHPSGRSRQSTPKLPSIDPTQEVVVEDPLPAEERKPTRKSDRRPSASASHLLAMAALEECSDLTRAKKWDSALVRLEESAPHFLGRKDPIQCAKGCYYAFLALTRDKEEYTNAKLNHRVSIPSPLGPKADALAELKRLHDEITAVELPSVASFLLNLVLLPVCLLIIWALLLQLHGFLLRAELPEFMEWLSLVLLLLTYIACVVTSYLFTDECHFIRSAIATGFLYAAVSAVMEYLWDVPYAEDKAPVALFAVVLAICAVVACFTCFGGNIIRHAPSLRGRRDTSSLRAQHEALYQETAGELRQMKELADYAVSIATSTGPNRRTLDEWREECLTTWTVTSMGTESEHLPMPAEDLKNIFLSVQEYYAMTERRLKEAALSPKA